MEESISSLREDLNSLNDSVSDLSVCLREHKEQTTVDVQQLNSRLDILATIQQCHSQEDSPTQTPPESPVTATNATIPTTPTTPTLTATTPTTTTTPTTPTPIATTPIIPTYTCGGTGGWRRVVYLDMTDPSTTCPSGWNATGFSKRTCGRATDGRDTCDSVQFSTGSEYSRVCGRIRAYQWGITEAFRNYHYGLDTVTIDNAYVDGISLTHSSPRQHIWTFAAGGSEGTQSASWVCPCDATRIIHVPPYVGEDYYCESGVNGRWSYTYHYTLHSNDTLWDGENCLSSSTCCSLHNPPYFVKELPASTTDNIEARICLFKEFYRVNIAIELVELYIQ